MRLGKLTLLRPGSAAADSEPLAAVDPRAVHYEDRPWDALSPSNLAQTEKLPWLRPDGFSE